MKTYLSFRLSYLPFLSILSFLICSSVSCRKTYTEIPEVVEFGSQGMVQNRDYVVTFPDSLLSSIENSLATLSIIFRYNEHVKLKDLLINYEYASLYSESVVDSFLNIPLFEEKVSFPRHGHMGILQKEILISDSVKVGEGFFFSFKTLQKNTFGLIDATVILQSNCSK